MSSSMDIEIHFELRTDKVIRLNRKKDELSYSIDTLREFKSVILKDWSAKSTYAKSIRAIGDNQFAINAAICDAKAASNAFKDIEKQYNDTKTEYRDILDQITYLNNIKCYDQFCFTTYWYPYDEYNRSYACSNGCPHRDNLERSYKLFEIFDNTTE